MTCGTDIVEICRIEKAISRYGDKFLKKVFTISEIEYCNNKVERFAVRFATKEAVAKALGTGIKDGICWTDIEISNRMSCAPYVMLHNTAKNIAEHLNIKSIEISLSHCKEYAVAVAIAN